MTEWADELALRVRDAGPQVVNDSKTPFGSRRDRHELVAEGSLGPEPFRRIMRDPRFRSVMKVIETPKGDDEVTFDRRMLRRLRAYGRVAR